MPAFWMEATLYTLDNQRFNQLLKKWQNEIMRGGVRRFLKATMARIPKRTGFLRGAFSDIRQAFAKDESADMGDAALIRDLLGRKKKDTNPNFANIIGKKKERNYVDSSKDNPVEREKRIQALMKKHEKYESQGQKNARDRLTEFYYASAGGKKSRIRKTSKSGIQFATPADKVLTFTDNVATFFLDVTISYYRINDNYGRIKGAPWHSLMEGGSAFTDWLHRSADLFPGITEILARQKISLRGSRITQTKLPQELVASRLLRITSEASNIPTPAPKSPAPAPSTPTNSSRELHRNTILARREAAAKKGTPSRWKFPAYESKKKKGE